MNLSSSLNRKFTIPRTPFSQRSLVPVELRKQKTRDLKPNKKFHDFHTIQWLRRKYNERVIKKSIYSLLPDNGNPVIDYEAESVEDKRKRVRMDWLSNYCQPKDNFDNVCINPKYFFNQKTFEKILKLKEIFLEFDEDGSRKMEIDEMEEMFNSNNIEATIKELAGLFFEGLKVIPDDLDKLYLDFYQFMQFALGKDQEFRLFMRKIKEKVKSQKEEKELMNKIQENAIQSKEDDNIYLPMNFNLVLDYFIIKGKERSSKEKIEKAIEEMTKIINNNKEEETTSEYTEQSSQKGEDPYEAQLQKINFAQLIQEFSNLFHIKDEKDQSPNDTAKKRGTMNRSKTRTVSVGRTRRNSNPNNQLDSNPSRNTCNENNKEMEESYYVYSEILNQQLSKEDISKMNMVNYTKYHSLKLALDETKKALKNPGLKKEASGDHSTMYGTGYLPRIDSHNNKNKSCRKNKMKKDYVPIQLLKELDLK